MQKKIFLSLFFLFCAFSNGQRYKMKWGTMIPIYDQPERPFSSKRNILSIPFVAEVNPKTGNLYIMNEYYNEILEFNPKAPKSKPFYKFSNIDGSSIIQQIKFDSNNNLIISGKTFNGDLATKGVYSEEMISTLSSGNSFIAKVSNKGTLIWYSYFHEIPVEKLSITIDKNDNIYILNKRFRSDVLKSSPFQKDGDTYSVYDYQDAITKLDVNGRHVWSTFYVSDNSKINAIASSDNGIYVYGMHQASHVSGNYFATPGSYKENIVDEGNNTSSVFLSKFDFDGKRLWGTYFGNEISYVPPQGNNIVKNPSNLVVIGDDAYFISSHKNILKKNSENLATSGVLINKPANNLENYTLTKFSGNGSREWTTYLNNLGNLSKSINNDELYISTSIDQESTKILALKDKKDNILQKKGFKDVYTYILSLDGKHITYETSYGFEGNDIGFSLPAINGYYTIGFANYYNKELSEFATKNAPLKKFKLFDTGIYVGNFISYFSSEKR